jgi:ribonuclease HI
MMTIYKTSSSVALIFNILWSIWKARNNLLFNKEHSTPLQVLHVAKALLYTRDVEQGEQGRLSSSPAVVSHSTSLVAFDINRVGKGPNIYTDAAWKSPSTSSSTCAGTRSKAGIGIFMHWINESNINAILVKATSMADSALQAEAQALELAAQLCQVMKVQHPNFLTDSQVLSEAATRRDPAKYPGHWAIRPNLHNFISCTQGIDAGVFKIKRENNKIAHKQAHDAYNLSNVGTCFYSCLGSRHDASNCPVKAVLSSLNVQSCTLMLVTCL